MSAQPAYIQELEAAVYRLAGMALRAASLQQRARHLEQAGEHELADAHRAASKHLLEQISATPGSAGATPG